MSRNPFLNAILAVLYIVIVASIMYYGGKIADPVDNILAPIAFLSLFVLSAAVMGLLFFLQPIQLYLEGQKAEAMSLFLKTLGTFAGITVLFLFSLFVALPFFT